MSKTNLPMLTLVGRVEHVYQAPKGISKKTGEEYGGGSKVQLVCDMPLQNGEVRRELQTLSTDQPELYEGFLDQWVRVPVGAYAAKAGVSFFALKGCQPEVLS